MRQGNFSGRLNNKRSADKSLGQMEFFQHCETSSELRDDRDVHAVFIKSLVGREKCQEIRHRDPERCIDEMSSHTDQLLSAEDEQVRIDTHQIRRPQPKLIRIVSLLRDPSSWRNLSGLNSSGLGYFVASCVIALKGSCSLFGYIKDKGCAGLPCIWKYNNI
jgi:hypothetical protein